MGETNPRVLVAERKAADEERDEALSRAKQIEKDFEKLKKEPEGRSKWLVVLTDLVDLSEHQHSHVSRGKASVLLEAMGKQLPNLALVVIDSEKISNWEVEHTLWPTWRSNMEMMVKGLEAKGVKTALRIACDSDEGIEAAFKRVAAMIGGVSEAL